MVLTIEYNPLEGICVPDGKASDYVSNIIREYKQTHFDARVQIGSEITINEFRLAVARNEINYKEIEFEYQSQKLSVNKFGKVHVWPVGFCDINSKIVRNLIKISSSRASDEIA